MTARTVIHPAGVTAMLRSPGIEADMGDRAERGAEFARSTAPVDTGTYRDAIESWTEVTPEAAVGRFGSTVPYSIYVQAQTGNLARALDAAL
jgi:hypothetical protein